jgi:amidase
VVKDNFNTDVELGMNTTAGSYALLGSEVRRDAFVISKLRNAGVLILGKANLQEVRVWIEPCYFVD